MDAPKYPSPLDANLALQVRDLDERQRAWFDERCAIRTIQTGQLRSDAELAAWTDLQTQFDLSPVASTSGAMKLSPRRKDRKWTGGGKA